MLLKEINQKRITIYILLFVIIMLSASMLAKETALDYNDNKDNKDNKEISGSIVVESKEKLKNAMVIEKNENIVIFGDSITEIYPVDEIFGSLPILKSGKSGYKTTDLLDNMKEMLYQYNPTKVILLIGVNDVLYDTSEEKQNETIENITEIIKKIKENRSKAKIYVESIYPVNKSLDDKFDFNVNNDVIINMNANIKKLCEKEKLTYINMYDELTDDNGNFAERYTYDGLHPSILGYAKITRVLLPYVYE